MSLISPEIFKAYDIRGIVGKTLTEATVEAIGRALGMMALSQGHKTFAIGRDGRLSGPSLAEALGRGLRACGVDTIDLGMVATPITYFAAHHLGCGSAVSVTGSHNPPDYNGLKMVMGGVTLSGEAIQTLRGMVQAGESTKGNDAPAPTTQGQGKASAVEVIPAYLDRIAGDIHLARPLKVVLDCGNGVAGLTAGPLIRRLGCEVTELYCDVDGNFPNHHPDPSDPHNLVDLIATVQRTGADLGLAFDGDGDRLGVVTPSGRIIYPDRQLMLFAKDVLSRCPGAEIIYDVKCTRQLAPWIRQHGGVPSMWRTGHSLIKARMKERKAPLAGEMSGHIFFGERWYGFDDGLYAAARLLEILSREANPGAVLEALPDSLSTPELQWKLQEGEPHALIQQLQQQAQFAGAKEVITLDGVRVEYADGFGLARASNTTPVIVLRFEADNPQALARIQAAFRQALSPLKPDAALPF